MKGQKEKRRLKTIAILCAVSLAVGVVGCTPSVETNSTLSSESSVVSKAPTPSPASESEPMESSEIAAPEESEPAKEPQHEFAGAPFEEINGDKFYPAGSTVLLSANGMDGTGRTTEDAFDVFLSPLGGNVKITFQGAEVYDDYTAAGISPEDLSSDYYSALDSFSVVVVQLTVENIDVQFTSDSPDEDFNISALTPAVLGGLTDSEVLSTYDNWYPTIEYFSPHGTGDFDYYHFRISPGESLDVQIGFSVHNQVLQDKQLGLRIGPNQEGQFYFDVLDKIGE